MNMQNFDRSALEAWCAERALQAWQALPIQTKNEPRGDWYAPPVSVRITELLAACGRLEDVERCIGELTFDPAPENDPALYSVAVNRFASFGHWRQAFHCVRQTSALIARAHTALTVAMHAWQQGNLEICQEALTLALSTSAQVPADDDYSVWVRADVLETAGVCGQSQLVQTALSELRYQLPTCDPKHRSPDNLAKLARAHVLEGQAATATTLFHEALDAFTTGDDTRYDGLDLYFTANRLLLFDEALAASVPSLAREPWLTDYALLGLFEGWLSLGKLVRAQETAATIGWGFMRDEAYCALALSLHRQGRNDEADQCLQKCLSKDTAGYVGGSDDAHVDGRLMKLAATYGKIGRIDKTMDLRDVFHAACSTTKGFSVQDEPHYVFAIAMAYGRAGRMDEGRAWLESLTNPQEIISAAAGLVLSQLVLDDPPPY